MATAQKIAAILKELQPLAKTQAHNYKAHSADTIYGLLRNKIGEAGLAIVASVKWEHITVDDGNNMTIPFRFELTDGEDVIGCDWVQIQPAAKDDRQWGKAVSYALKTWLKAMFLISEAGDDLDMDEPREANAPYQGKPKPQAHAPKPQAHAPKPQASAQSSAPKPQAQAPVTTGNVPQEPAPDNKAWVDMRVNELLVSEKEAFVAWLKRWLEWFNNGDAVSALKKARNIESFAQYTDTLGKLVDELLTTEKGLQS